MKKLYALIGVIALFLLGAGAVFGKWNIPGIPATRPEPVFCTMEAKMCPDGSYVGRTGPKCEFAACPVGTETENASAKIGQRILNNGIYITPLSVTEDSRCPKDAACVWAGRLVLQAKLEKGAVTKKVNLTLGVSLDFEGNKITLESVSPEKNSKTSISAADYRFTFKVSPFATTNADTGTVFGRVTLSPTCPVERMPPDPMCAPKPYSTSIAIRESGQTSVVKTVQANSNGEYSADLPPGSYELTAKGGTTMPRCSSVTLIVRSGASARADISCDTGIR